MQRKRKQRKKWSKIFHKNLTRLKEEETITTTSPSNFSMQTKSESLMENFPKKKRFKRGKQEFVSIKKGFITSFTCCTTWLQRTWLRGTWLLSRLKATWL